jgi:hypothetical protein
MTRREAGWVSTRHRPGGPSPPESEVERDQEHHDADDHEDEPDDADVDARGLPGDRIAEDRAESDEEERASKPAGGQGSEGNTRPECGTARLGEEPELGLFTSKPQP